MGCGGSTRAKNPGEFEMEKTEVVDVDAMFEELAVPIRLLHHAYEGLSKALKDLKFTTGTHILKGHKVEDSIEGMLICFLASCDGDWDKLDIKFKNSSPYITLNRNDLNKIHVPIIEAWDKLVKNILDLPGELVGLTEEILNISEKVNTYPDRAKEAILNAGLNPLQAIKATKAVAVNLAKIAQSAKMLDECKKALSGTLEALSAVAIKLDSESEKTRLKKLGKAASALKIFDPKKIIENSWAEKSRVDLKLEA